MTALIALFAKLVAEGDLELEAEDTKPALRRLALRWLDALGQDHPDDDEKLADWLIEQPEVGDVFGDADRIEIEMRRALREATADLPGPFEQQAATSAHEPLLAAAIVDAPRDLDARAVYADWLLEQGDPRGELMLVQLELARLVATKTRGKAKLQRREKEILAVHRRHFFGTLATEQAAGFDRVLVELVNGFFTTAKLPAEDALRTLLELESSRFLEQLEVACTTLAPITEVLAVRPLPRSLRRLRIARRTDRYITGGTPLGDLDLGAAVAGLAHLETLDIAATRLRLDSLASTKLREVTLRAARLDLGEHAFDGIDALDSLVVDAFSVNGINILAGFLGRARVARLELGEQVKAAL